MRSAGRRAAAALLVGGGAWLAGTQSGLAEFQYNVLPYKDTLEVTLTKIPIGSSIEPNVTLSRSRVTNTYKVQLINQNSQAIQGDHPLGLTKNQAGRERIVDIPMQLYNPVIDTIRKKTFGTVFRDTSPLNAIAYVLVKYASTTTGEANNTIRGVNVDPSFEITERKHIVVPHNTPVLEVPHLIDDAVGGTHPAQNALLLARELLEPLSDI